VYLLSPNKILAFLQVGFVSSESAKICVGKEAGQNQNTLKTKDEVKLSAD
jgi:hypothetical protein